MSLLWKTAAERGWYTDPKTGHDMMPMHEFKRLWSSDHGGRVEDSMKHFQERWEKDKSSHPGEAEHGGPRAYVDHLKRDIGEYGLDKPLAINGMELADGHHRGLALMELGHTHVPVKAWEPDEDDEDW